MSRAPTTPGSTPLGDLLDAAAGQLAEVSDSPRLDAEVLLCHVLGKPRSYLFTWPDRTLDADDEQAFGELLQRRLAGTPVAHITGVREFWSLPLKITPDTLIPRPETELLVEFILESYPAEPPLKLADLGTGSGAIALAIAGERPAWTVIASDHSDAALAVARDNARELGLAHVAFRQGDWCEVFETDERFDIIVSNPPYIVDSDPHLERGDVRFEPLPALASGPRGLDAIGHICECARRHLNPGGLLVLEHGYDQQRSVHGIFTQYGYQGIRQHRDMAGHSRATSGIFSL